MNDRLNDLMAMGKDNPFLDDPEDPDDDAFLNEYYKRAEKIRNGTEVMRQKVNELREFYDSSLGNVISKNKKNQKEIDDLMDATNSTAHILREDLQRLGNEIKEGEKNEDRIKKNIHTSLLEDFLDLMQEYQSIQNNHNEEMRRLVKAQVHLVDPQATDETVEKAILGGPQMIFSSDKVKAAQESLNYIQNKHTEILKLERSLEEVHQLFVDMSVLVQEQSEMINSIAFQVTNAKNDIRDATNQLREANKIQRKKCLIQ
jgi:t-SNARE complex subunit (syntaxin)